MVDHDFELVKKGQAGDVEAVGLLFDRHHRRIFGYFWARVSNRQQAEDLTGELFARMVTHLPTFKPSGVPFRAWLYRIAYNLTMDHFRVANGQAVESLEQTEAVAAAWHNPAQIVEQQLTLEQVQQAVAQLVPEQRQVVILRFLSGLSLQEVADVLDRSLPAVKALQHRGLKILRALLIGA